MKHKKNILFTFDYELFLGNQSGDIINCLINPINKLQSIFDKFEISKAIFFVDTTYLMALKKCSHSHCISDFNSIIQNVRFLLDKGHYVFPHIHPHWLNAKYDGLNWSLNNLNLYRFSNCSKSQKDEIWDDSFQILKNIGVDKYHKIDSFRAGGWSIQPFVDFKPYFLKYGLKYDFTVLPNAKSNTEAHVYDFTKIKSTYIYNFENEIDSPLNDGSFTEIPISFFNKIDNTSLIKKIYDKCVWHTINRPLGNGKGVVTNINNNSQNFEMVSIELLNHFNFKNYKDFILENNFMHFISHPKMLSKLNLKLFEKFMIYVKNNDFIIEYDFKKLVSI